MRWHRAVHQQARPQARDRAQVAAAGEGTHVPTIIEAAAGHAEKVQAMRARTGPHRSVSEKCGRATAASKTETEEKILAEQCVRMAQTLVGPSVQPLAERVKKVIRMAEAVREAAQGGSYEHVKFEEPPAPQPPPIKGSKMIESVAAAQAVAGE